MLISVSFYRTIQIPYIILKKNINIVNFTTEKAYIVNFMREKS